MKRIQIEERPDWRQTAHHNGFHFHTFGDEVHPKADPVSHQELEQGVQDVLATLSKEARERCMGASIEETADNIRRLAPTQAKLLPQPKKPIDYWQPEKYWDESAYYEFTLKQIEDDLEDPTTELHEMCMNEVAKIVDSEELMTRLHIPASFHDYVRESWKQGHPHLYGRMDFAYNGEGPAKLLELNYDTPTSLYEASAFQWIWMTQQKKRFNLPGNANQFNNIHTELGRLFEHLRTSPKFMINKPFYFSAISTSPEDIGTVEYLRDIAHCAGHETYYIHLEDIGMNENRKFVDLDDKLIPYIFQLNAWEFLMREDAFGAAIPKSDTCFFEPAWKALLSNKGFLPMLWESHKGHPNLLQTVVDKDPNATLGKGWVRKPYFSREGANIELVTPDGELIKVPGPYTDAPYILQEYTEMPKFEDSYTLLGSWIVGDKACGIGIREDDSKVTKDTSRFLPHIFLE
ncbi:glutathionylspermidine synthase family protein [Pseudomonas aeruginosa]